MDLDDAADELFGLMPAEFVSRRNELAKQAKADGDPELSSAIRGLRRPTHSAWALNQWVRSDPDGVAALTTLAAELAAAQRRGEMARVRELSQQRQTVVSDSAAAVADLATDRGLPMSGGAVGEVSASLRAAIADEAVAAVLTAGRFVTAVEYSGFGPAGVFLVPDAEPPTDAASTSVEQADEDETDDPRAAARAELAAATEEAARIRDELEHAGDTVDEATESTDRLSTKVEELRVQLAAADEELLFARRKQVAAREAYDDAQTRLRVAEQRVHTARRDAEA
ncbi:hypothetical protein [Gordonia sp. NPDC003585]|uniref:hypothetical protein n=1 Tax=Gordonia sp. NPDC003585 TaxID=3154275 RepID=UPI00339EB80E